MTERGRVFVALEGPARPARSAINLTKGPLILHIFVFPEAVSTFL